MEALQASLGPFLAAEPAASETGPPGASLPLDLREKLAALGYVGGPGPAGAADPGADPKDKIDDLKIATDLMKRAFLRLNEEDFAGSAELFQDLLGRGVRSFELHLYLARALQALKRHREAAAQYELAVGLDPAYPAAWGDLANCRVALGDLRGAVEAIRSGQESSPRDADLRRSEARLWRRLGEREKARRAYESALPLAPGDALLRAHLGELLRDMGEVGTSASCSATWERWRRQSAVYGRRWSSTPRPPPTGTPWEWSSVLTGDWPRPRPPSARPGSVTTRTRSTRSTLASLCCAWAARKRHEASSRRRSSWNRASSRLASTWPKSAPDALAASRCHGAHGRVKR